MRRAVALADEAAAAGDVPIGAILIVGARTFEARNEKELRPDPTAHAELLAIQAAARALGVWRVGGTLYVTKEPCAMCAGAIAAARIERLVFGCADPKGGAAGSVIDVLASTAINHRVAVTRGVLEAQTAQQLREYFRAKRVGRNDDTLYRALSQPAPTFQRYDPLTDVVVAAHEIEPQTDLGGLGSLIVPAQTDAGVPLTFPVVDEVADLSANQRVSLR